MSSSRTLPRSHPVCRLRRLAEVLAIVGADSTGDPELASDAAWLADAIQRYDQEASGGTSIATALGLARKAGDTAWWHAEALERRNGIIREVRQTFFGDLAVEEAAKEIIRAAGRCARQTRRPDAGPTKLLAEAMRFAPIPKTPKTVRTILEMNKPNSLSDIRIQPER